VDHPPQRRVSTPAPTVPPVLVWLNDTDVPLSATDGFVVEPVKVSLTSAHATPPVTYHNQPALAQPSRARSVPIELILSESMSEADAQYFGQRYRNNSRFVIPQRISSPQRRAKAWTASQLAW
jgi:hypothetical protein